MAPRLFSFGVRGNSKVNERDKRDLKVEQPDESGSKVEKLNTSNETPSAVAQRPSKRFGRTGSQPTGPYFGIRLPRSRKKSRSDAIPQTIQTPKEMIDGREVRHLAAPSVPVDGDNSLLQQEQIKSYGDEITLTPNDTIVAIMGVTGSGKSTLVSLLSDEDIAIGHGLVSCTTKVNLYHFTLDGKRIWLVDTPGFDDTNRSDTAVLKDVAFWLAGVYTKKTCLAGIIYLHRIIDVRMQGSALRNLRLLKELCGASNLKSVILATTHWTDKEGNSVPESVGQARMKELTETKDFWGGMIDLGSRVERHDGSKDSAKRIVSDLVKRKDRVELVIQKQLVDEKRILFDTDAGQELQRELIEERKTAEARLAELKLDMESALQDKDKRWQEQIEIDRADFEEKIRRGYRETESLKINLKKIMEEKDEQFRAMKAKLTRERAAWEAQYWESRASTHKQETGQRLMSDRQRLEQAYAQERELFQKRQDNALRLEYGAPFRM